MGSSPISCIRALILLDFSGKVGAFFVFVVNSRLVRLFCNLISNLMHLEVNEMKTKMSMGRNTQLTVQEAFEMFIRSCTVKNLSERTIKTYRHHYSLLVRFKSSDDLIESINKSVIEDYVLFLRGNTSANDITINSYLRSLRAFLYYCMENNYLPRFKIEIPKAEKKIKETYSMDELERLLMKPDVKTCDFSEYKIWVLENYLLGTGNRISSALNLKIKDIDFYNATILVQKTKSRKQQIIPLSNSLNSILQEYLTYRGGEGEDYLFCNMYGERANLRSVQEMVCKYNLARNVKKTSCHLFRHTFAKNWILAGGDIFRLQKILGHSDLTVTKEYLQMFGNDVALDFEKFNPLDNMKSTKQRRKLVM